MRAIIFLILYLVVLTCWVFWADC